MESTPARRRRRVLAWSVLSIVGLCFVSGASLLGQPAHAEVSDPSGTYQFSGGLLGSRAITLACSPTSCAVDGIGTTILAERGTNTTALWQREGWVTPGAPIAVARVSLTGREYGASVPNYPSITRLWIADSMNGVTLDFRAGSREGALSEAVSGSTSQPGVLLVWGNTQGAGQSIQLFVFGQGRPDLQKDCLSDSRGCWSIGIGGGSREQPTATTTVVEVTTTTPADVTTTSDVSTTIAETEVSEATTTTVVEGVLDSEDSADPLPVDSVEPDEDRTGDSFDSPALNQPSTPANSVATAAIAVSTISAVVAAGAAASTTSGAGSGSGPGGGNSSQTGTGRATATNPSNDTSVSAKEDALNEKGVDEGRQRRPSGGTEPSLFTTEQLERGQRLDSDVFVLPYPPDDRPVLEEWTIWAPNIIRSSRIICRTYTDILLIGSLCQTLRGQPLRPDRTQPGLQALLIISLALSTVGGAVAGLTAPTSEVGSPIWAGAVASGALLCGMFSAVHGFFFAAALLTTGSFIDQFRSGLLLTIVITLVLSTFIPVLSNTFCQPRSLDKIDKLDWWNLTGGVVAVGAISLKTVQEFAQQVGRVQLGDGFLSAYGNRYVTVPAVIGGLITLVRFFVEKHYRESAQTQPIGRFLVASARLRSGEIPIVSSKLLQILGASICTMFVGFVVVTYTNHLGVTVVVTACFVGVVFANMDPCSRHIARWPLPSSPRLPKLSAWLKLGFPAVLAIALSVLLAVVAPTNLTLALWMTCGFALLNLFVELYDVYTDPRKFSPG